ncbi:DUF4127 family protein [Paenibacillus sp. 1P07SE]|uniref:DUF4127 family protein n=1 Tax=Paenibacillus sp. 1P07SE TaxID=3132209 RepID=UPI0039A77664
MKKVLYVPLDDRPANLADVIALGRTAGLDVIVPPAEDTANELDTRVYTEGTLVTGTSDPIYGKPDKIRRFIQMHAARVDGFVISIDMLVYGGLIGSRNLQEEETDHGRETRHLLDVIRRIKRAHPGKPVFVHDTIMRLATTTFAGGLTFEAYEESRQLMSQPRQPASAFEEILAGYDLRPDGTTFGETVHFDKEAYYRTRRHKLRTTRYVLEELAAQGDIDFLAVGVDDAYTEGAQANEIAWAHGRIDACLGGQEGQNPERAIILPDADGLGHSLMARMAARLLGGDNRTSYSVTYYGPHGSELINPYEYMSVHDNLLRHVDMIGGRTAGEGEAPDIDVIAITAVDQTAAAVERLEANGAAQQATVVIDFTGFVAHPEVTAALLANPWTGRLLGYSAWNTAGNKIGIALGMGEARYAGLTGLSSQAALDAAVDAHGSLLFKRFLKDYYYKAVAIAEIRQMSRSRTPYTNVTADQHMRLFNTEADYEALTVLLRELMQEHTDTLRGQTAFLAGGEDPARNIRQICGDRWFLSAYADAVLPVDNPAFTWGRAFEIDLDPVVTLAACPSDA